MRSRGKVPTGLGQFFFLFFPQLRAKREVLQTTKQKTQKHDRQQMITMAPGSLGQVGAEPHLAVLR
jgi:hypothetical protein